MRAARGRSVVRVALGIVLGATVFAAGCREAAPPSSVPAITKDASSEGGSLRVSLSAAEISTAERVVLGIEVESKAGWNVEMPRVSETPGAWSVVGRWASERSTDKYGVSHQRARIVLEPDLDGEYTVPALTATFRSDHAPSRSVSASVPEIPVHVRSVLADTSVADVPPPVDLPPQAEPTARVWPMVAGSVLVMVGAFVLAVYVRQRRTVSSEEVDPIAVRRLALSRALARDALSPVDLDSAAAVLRAVPAGPNARALNERLDVWRFGREAPDAAELRDAVRRTLDLVAATADGPGGVA